MDIIIRIADRHKDSAGICRLINDSLGYKDVTPDALAKRMERMDAAGGQHGYFTLVAEADGLVAGFVSVAQGIAVEIEGDYFRIIALAVDEEHRRMGIGGRLLARVEEIAAERGVWYFTLSSGFQRTDAHAFYERQGYEKRSFAFSKGTK